MCSLSSRRVGKNAVRATPHQQSVPRRQRRRAADPAPAGARRAGRRGRRAGARLRRRPPHPDRRRAGPGARRGGRGGRHPAGTPGAVDAGPLADAPAVRGAGPPGLPHRLRRGDGPGPHPLLAPQPRRDRRAVRRRPGPGAPRGPVHPGVHRDAGSLDACGGPGVRRHAGSGRVVALVSVGITAERIQDALADRLPAIGLAAVDDPRRRAAGRLADQPAAATADPRPRRAGDHPDVRVLRRRAARRARGTAARRRRRPGAAAQRRGAAPARPRRRRGRAARRRPRPAPVPGAGDPVEGPAARRDPPARRRRPGGQHRPGPVAGPRRRPRGDPARPHRAPGRRRGARHRPRARGVAALAEPRGVQPAAHGRLPGRAGAHRRGPGLRDRGARDRPAAHRPGGRLGVRPGGLRAAARQDRAGRGARGAAADRRGHRRHRAPGRPAGRGHDPGQPGRQRHRRGRGRGHPGGPGRPDRLPRLPATCGSPTPATACRRAWSTRSSSAGGRPRPPTGQVGRGLGLALVVQAVRRYGGHVDVAVSELGGAQFDVRIGTGS